jgi:hypothetical protein
MQMLNRDQLHNEMRQRAAAEVKQLFMVVKPDACPVCEMHRGKFFWPDEAPRLPIGGCLKPDCSCEYRLFDPNGPSLSQMLEEGIQAVKAGRVKEAQDWFVSLLQIDRYNEKAWLWLSGAADDDQDRLECILEVLNINPENAIAQRGLSALRAKGVTAPESAETETDTRS